MLLFTHKTLAMKNIYSHIISTRMLLLQFINGFIRKWIVDINHKYECYPQPGRSLFVQHYEPGVIFCQYQISISQKHFVGRILFIYGFLKSFMIMPTMI